MADTTANAKSLVEQLQAEMAIDRANRQLLLADIAERFKARDLAYDARLTELRGLLVPPAPEPAKPDAPSRRGHRSGMWCEWGSYFPYLGNLETLQTVDGELRPCDQFSTFSAGGKVSNMRLGLVSDQVAACVRLAKLGLHADVAMRPYPTAGTRPAVWPAKLGDADLISPTNPPGTGMPTREDAVQVVRMRADGFFDDLHRAMVRAIRKQLPPGTVCDFRYDWEGANWAWEPLSTHTIGSNCASMLETDQEIELFHRCQARIKTIIREEYGPDGNLFLCLLKQGSGKRNDMDLFNPDACDYVGIDYYNCWPALKSEADFDLANPKALINLRRGNGAPYEIGAWLKDFEAKFIGPWKGRAVKGVMIGEWGVVSTDRDPSRTYSGGDNPLFVTRMFDLFWQFRHIIHGVSYFNNKDGAFWEHRLQAGPGTKHPAASAAYADSFARYWRLSQVGATL